MVPHKYWKERCVKAELMLVEIQSLLDGCEAPQYLSDKISGYFNDLRKRGDQSNAASSTRQEGK